MERFIFHNNAIATFATVFHPDLWECVVCRFLFFMDAPELYIGDENCLVSCLLHCSLVSRKLQAAASGVTELGLRGGRSLQEVEVRLLFL